MLTSVPRSVETVCVVDDDVLVNQTLCAFLREEGYVVKTFPSANEFLLWWEGHTDAPCDLVVSDVSMPGSSGYDLCRKIRAKVPSQLLPIILLTGGISPGKKAEGIEVGADEFIEKPFRRDELLAKIKSLLKIRAHNSSLNRFIPPNIAALLSTDATRSRLRPHRAEVTVMFADLRRFTAFSERVEPEEVLEVLGQYYRAVGNSALKHSGTLGHLAGDGIMVFFNDPEPVENHLEVGLTMALEVRDELNRQKVEWDARQYDIDFGIGLAQGYATIGGIGFDRFWQYSVIGPVTNFASRLCHLADHGQILVSSRFLARVGKTLYESEPIGDVTLKGISKSVSSHNVLTRRKGSERKAA